MISRKTSLFLSLFILFIIFFDALQQKYYLDTFDFASQGVRISFGILLKNHLIRWVMWISISIPFSFAIWRKFKNRENQTSSKDWTQISGLAILATIISIAMVSASSMVLEGSSFSLAEFWEIFEFFTFQKGLAFMLAFFTLTLILYNQSKHQIISEQSITIENLKKRSSSLASALESVQETEPHLNVKTGYKMKPIPLNEIIWIQADDYCVKIHTKQKSFTLRQSLKVLEQKLEAHQFIRIHRGALLNLSYLDQVNYETATIQLTDTSELPLSKSGIQSLKRRLQKSAV